MKQGALSLHRGSHVAMVTEEAQNDAPPTALPRAEQFSVSPRWMCELKEFWETLHLARHATTPTPSPTPPNTQMFSPSSLSLLQTNIPSTNTRRRRSPDVFCRGRIPTQPLTFRRLEGREDLSSEKSCLLPQSFNPSAGGASGARRASCSAYRPPNHFAEPSLAPLFFSLFLF